MLKHAQHQQGANREPHFPLQSEKMAVELLARNRVPLPKAPRAATDDGPQFGVRIGTTKHLVWVLLWY